MSYMEQTISGKKWCYDCLHYYMDYCCGYSASQCRIHGSLDCDQNKRHPDRTADTCRDYTQNGRPPWWFKYEDFSSITKDEFESKYCRICDAYQKCGGVYSKVNCGLYRGKNK